MKQRLKLAQALVHDPDLLLLDEPTNGMDPKGREQMLALVWDLTHRQHFDVIFSSHLLPDIERTCESVVILHHGVVAYAGHISDWYRLDKRVYEVRVGGDLASFLAALRAAGCEFDADDGKSIRVVPADGNSRLIFAAAVAARVQIRHLRVQRPTLEELVEEVTTEPIGHHDTGPNARG